MPAWLVIVFMVALLGILLNIQHHLGVVTKFITYKFSDDFSRWREQERKERRSGG